MLEIGEDGSYTGVGKTWGSGRAWWDTEMAVLTWDDPWEEQQYVRARDKLAISWPNHLSKMNRWHNIWCNVQAKCPYIRVHKHWGFRQFLSSTNNFRYGFGIGQQSPPSLHALQTDNVLTPHIISKWNHVQYRGLIFLAQSCLRRKLYSANHVIAEARLALRCNWVY